MALVSFKRGLAEDFSHLIGDEFTFYYTTDTKELYIGQKKLTNPEDLEEALKKITTNETEIATIKSQLSNYVARHNGNSLIENEAAGAVLKYSRPDGGASAVATNDGSNNIDVELYSLDADDTGTRLIINQDGAYYTHKDDMTTTDDDKLVVAKDLKSLIVTATDDEVSPDYAKVYKIKQGEKDIVTINIPKDMVVQSAKIKTVTSEEESEHPEGTYIVLTIANATEDEVWIDVGKLVDIYTVDEAETNVTLTIDQIKNTIKAEIGEGKITATEIANNTITKDKLATGVTNSLAKADTAVQPNQITNFVTGVIEDEQGTAAILNDKTGGQLLYLAKNDDMRANVSVNNGQDENNIYVQLSATDKQTNQGSRINLTKNKAYYTSNKNSAAVEEDDEIATKKDFKAYTPTTNLGDLASEDKDTLISELDSKYDKTGAANEAETKAKQHAESLVTWGDFSGE